MSQVVESARRAKEASRLVASLDDKTKAAVLNGLADCIEGAAPLIQMVNGKDVMEAQKAGLAEAKLARLRINGSVIEQTMSSLRQIAGMPDPVGQVTLERTTPIGLRVKKVRTPLGVVAMIYEARPMVTIDAFALCFKSGNACILKGGGEACESNLMLMKLIHAVLAGHGLPADACVVLAKATREEVRDLLTLDRYVDVAIPRGGEELIRFVQEHAKVPLLFHARGVCHIFVDQAADMDMAEKVCVSAKTSAPATCNAAECVLVHEGVAAAAVPRLVGAFVAAGVEVRGCARTCELDSRAIPAAGEDFGREFLGLTVALKVVPGMDEAIAHIEQFGSDHTEAIITGDERAAEWFSDHVRSSCVVVNASTRFNDGFSLGLGAEIGISTTRLHAYGPMGLEELTTQRWVVRGDGQVR
ncbi:glutamate-5-semialdehyde dehydrogenase [Phycisphaerales bacterium]|nr:glutamate-5-semialdehyde dehydrogenase [Phycisphaerales bacterium]